MSITNDFEGHEAVMHLQIKESASKYKVSTKCDIIEQLISENSRISIDFNGESYNVMIKDYEGNDILGPFSIKLTEMGYSSYVNSKSKKKGVEQHIANLQREPLVSPNDNTNELTNLDLVMPRINGEKGLHLFLCPVAECTEMYVRIASAKMHALAHLNIKPYSCDYPGCRWSFYTMAKLTRHKDTHTKRKDYQCLEEGCGKRFTTMYNYKEHKKKHELPAIIQCPVLTCTMKFQNHKARNEHVKNMHHRSEASFLCPVLHCNKRFFSAVTLQGHSRSHSHNIESLTCRLCDKVFALPCRLKAHLIKHTGEKPHICNTCQRGFRSSSKLKRHIATHTNDRKYKCTVCEKKFLRSESLKDHMDTHGHKHRDEKVDTLSLDLGDPNINLNATLSLSANANSGDILLEQAIQSLGVPSDIMLSSYIEEPTLDFLDSVDNESFSTVNLRDFGINV